MTFSFSLEFICTCLFFKNKKAQITFVLQAQAILIMLWGKYIL